MRSFLNSTLHHILLGNSNQGRCDIGGRWDTMDRIEMHLKTSGNSEIKIPIGRPGYRWEDKNKIYLAGNKI
jgi:hypothetical protein